MRVKITLCLLLGAIGCASPPVTTEPMGTLTPEQTRLSQGYALLYELVSKQSDLGKALILGPGMSGEDKALIGEIAEASRSAAEAIRAFADADATLRLDHTALPEAEARSRDVIEASMPTRLIFAGGAFPVRLLLSEAEATRYGQALCKTLGEWDDNEVRRKWLEGFGKSYGEFHDRIESRLTVRKG